MRILLLVLCVCATLGLNSCSSSTEVNIPDAVSALPGTWEFTSTGGATSTSTITVSGTTLSYKSTSYDATFSGATATANRSFDFGGITQGTKLVFTMTSATTLTLAESQSVNGVTVMSLNYNGVKK